MTIGQRYRWLWLALAAAGVLIVLNLASLSLLGGGVIIVASPILNWCMGAAQVSTLEHRLQLNLLVLFFFAGTFWPLCLVPVSGIAFGLLHHRALWLKLIVLIGGLYCSAVIVTLVVYFVVAPHIGPGV